MADEKERRRSKKKEPGSPLCDSADKRKEKEAKSFLLPLLWHPPSEREREAGSRGLLVHWRRKRIRKVLQSRPHR